MRFAISEDGVQIGSLYAKVKDVLFAANDWSMGGHPCTISAVGSNGLLPIFTFEIVEDGQTILVTDLVTEMTFRKNRTPSDTSSSGERVVH